MKQKDYAYAAEQLRLLLRQHLSPDLLKFYAHLPLDLTELSFLESLLKKHEPSAELYVCLAQICFKKHLWGKTKYYLEKSLEIKPSMDAYAELGRLLEHSNDLIGACAAYRNMIKIYNACSY